ncbi:transaldolase [Aquirhabdus parva]|uniref:Transaldolase n=1 Tax=Aquirhabdus parva TaxID=2283318 RepID=A0A345P4Y4_9GAMM|nr:transaldolase [Aquirhabdus parva]AXI02343.1 transaldolase [Aquirhabdus parva]
MTNNTTQTLLSQLQSMTTVVADTGDIGAIERFRPIDATTNPSLITAAASLPSSLPLIEEALHDARAEGLAADALVDRAIDLLTVRLGIEILKLIKGRVSTEVDARLSYDTAETIAKAHELIDLYAQAGIDKSRVLIKIAATWEGIQAARALELEGIHCNLTLIFGLHQAIACADAGITLISPFVGRILDWYKKHDGKDSYPIELDPGVLSVREIYAYFKQHGHKTEVMGASFRSIAQVTALAGCDLLTIAPALLAELSEETGVLTQQLSIENAKQPPIASIDMTQEVFEKMHNDNLMAFELLQGGIGGFVKAREQLTSQLRQMAGIPDIHR